MFDDRSGGQILLGCVQQHTGKAQFLRLSGRDSQRKVPESIATTRRGDVVADVSTVLSEKWRIYSVPDSRDTDHLVGW